MLSLAQARLREQARPRRLHEQSAGRPDPTFKRIAELLPVAATEMRAAEGRLQAQSADTALPPENRALQQLQKAEEEYEKQVTSNNGGGGGGGGGAGSISEDLADLFKMEMDKLANQYETTQGAAQEAADEQVDELAEKLKELARRQQQEAERQRQRAGGQLGPGGGAVNVSSPNRRRSGAASRTPVGEQQRPDLAEAATDARTRLTPCDARPPPAIRVQPVRPVPPSAAPGGAAPARAPAKGKPQ